MKSRVLNECRVCGNKVDSFVHGETGNLLKARNVHKFVPVVVWELSEAEVKLLKEAKK